MSRTVLTKLFSFYDEGLTDGQNEGRRAGLREGTEFGIQTGYTRFIALGVLRGRLAVWQKQFAPTTTSPTTTTTTSAPDHPNIDRIRKNLAGLESMLAEIPVTNSDADVAVFEGLVRKAKSKAKVTASLIKSGPVLTYHDGTVGLRSQEEAIEDFRM